ncbi:enoyl-CoA hydratase-related protein [Aliiglaciecola sp. LCG003]|uniref:enoyl-CoA hydratase/isomerase family protein n=1 Tax=Aliiglaciecola sp. LCG003 TaxID=3053655 RepID=UPI002572269F|nr:enoyl-CoA hydratase-related protein [Aliiglaciecola sp. LCG003]WJG08077.1 enoyl-CoA hydratase-related protein [Aliiglaciecola sp. LCG003]
MLNIKQQDYQEILIAQNNGVLTITLNRPHKKNAMNLALVNEVTGLFASISDSSEIRAVVLRGSEGNFCAGGDISDMHKDAASEEQRHKTVWEFNRSFGRMITQVNHAPQVVVSVLEGAVLGGGFGLACVSDVAIADANAAFSMPETGLGIIPAQIAPFVVARIGLTHARRLALLGERIGGEEAKTLGIVHFVCHSATELQEQLDRVVKQVRRCAPKANAATKALMLKVGQVELESLLDEAADAFTQSLTNDEGQEGTQAFLQKRKPNWSE